MKIFLAVLLLGALTRAELIERMRAVPITKVNGLVQVIADCPRDMREEFQMPVASFASDICTMLYRARREQPRRFYAPGIQIFLGEERTNNLQVVSQQRIHGDKPYTRLFLPAPGFTDKKKLQREIIKAFQLALENKEISDAEADELLLAANPDLRAEEMEKTLSKWLKGEIHEGENDDKFLSLMHRVIRPGVATKQDVLIFASCLQLYPEIFSAPFLGKYHSCTFSEAIDLAAKDARVRFLAYVKAPQILAYGGGRSEELSKAAIAYSDFLLALAAYEKKPDELRAALSRADEYLAIAFRLAQ